MRHMFLAMVGLVSGVVASGCAESTDAEGHQASSAPEETTALSELAAAPQSVPLIEQPVACPEDICCDSYCCIGTYYCVWVGDQQFCQCGGIIGCCNAE